MSFLTRRVVQELIDEGNIPAAGLTTIVKWLNGVSREALAAEWELIILTALSRVGVVEYEPTLGGRSKLDFLFRDAAGLEIAGDITAISDDELDKLNLVDHFLRELMERSRAQELGGCLMVGIDSEPPVPGRKSQGVRLRLPAPHLFKEYIFNQDFDRFLDQIRTSPNDARAFCVRNSHAGVRISYGPSKSRTMSINFASFTSPRDLVRNSLYNRLKKKTDQINASGYMPSDGVRGILICDAGSAIFGQSAGSGEVGRHKIAQHFLRRTKDIDFIAFVTVTQSDSGGELGQYRYTVDGISRGSAASAAFGRILEDGLKHIPPPIRTAINARNHSVWRQRNGRDAVLRGNHIRGTMSAQQVSLSSRAVFDYLTGRIDKEWFERLADPGFLSILRRDLDSGCMVDNVEFRRRTDMDDDELIISWSEADPAVAPYRLQADA